MSKVTKGTRMMFVMGEKDETALGKPANKGLLTSKIRPSLCYAVNDTLHLSPD